MKGSAERLSKKPPAQPTLSSPLWQTWEMGCDITAIAGATPWARGDAPEITAICKELASQRQESFKEQQLQKSLTCPVESSSLLNVLSFPSGKIHGGHVDEVSEAQKFNWKHLRKVSILSKLILSFVPKQHSFASPHPELAGHPQQAGISKHQPCTTPSEGSLSPKTSFSEPDKLQTKTTGGVSRAQSKKQRRPRCEQAGVTQLRAGDPKDTQTAPKKPPNLLLAVPL